MNTARRSLSGIPRPGIAGLGLLLGALSGCFNPTPPANVLCAPDGWCPSGQTCDMSRWQCVPNGQIPDAGGWPWYDSGWPWLPDAAVPPWWDAAPGEGIEDALTAPWGPVSISIKEVLVTYVMPPLGLEAEGFFVQRDATGPALFVALSPNFTGVRLAVGDRVSFHINEMSGVYENPVATSITELVVHRRNEEVASLVQDVSGDVDLVNNPFRYVGELVSADLQVQGDFYEATYGFRIAQVATNLISDNWALVIRLPIELHQETGLERGCTLRVDGVPLWRYWSETLFSVQSLSELGGVTCPEPLINSAVAETDTSVRLVVSRNLDPATVEPDGSQFTISGLEVTAAAVDGRFVTLTTSSQTAGQVYEIQVEYGVRDIFGGAIPWWNLPSFQGTAPRARVRINEIKANIAPSCDLIELRVTQGGVLNDVRVTEQGTTIHTIRNLSVATNDLIVIHFNGFSTPCNPGRSPSETLRANQHPRVVFGANFDTAYDIYVAAVGLETTPHTVAVLDGSGNLQDIVLLTGAPGSAPDAGSLVDAASAANDGEWRTEAGTVPPGGFTDTAFTTHAVGGLDQGEVSIVSGWSALDGRPSVQRVSNVDNNHRGDWTTTPHTFGLLNGGQSPL